MDTELEEMKDILKKYGQEHLLNHYNELDEKKKEILLNQIRNIDFELVNKLYDSTKEQKVNTNDKITPINYLDKYKLNDQYKYYESIGKKAIKEGKLAAVTMAGGQGTRLGHSGPKGTYDIGLDSHKSLFELSQKYNITIELVYYPPYHSKYNKIERVWARIQIAWNGLVIDTLDKLMMILSRITWKGNNIKAYLNTTTYEKGIEVSKREFERIEKEYVLREKGIEKWSVIINPSKI